MMKLFSYDAETNGLWGESFSIGAIVADENGNEVDRFLGRCPIREEVDPWVRENVLPQMKEVQITAATYEEMLADFIHFWMKYKDETTTITHMGMIVESKLWRDARKFGFLGYWDAPYLTADVCTYADIGDSVDDYCRRRGINVNPADFAGGTHNPLYDSAAALKAFVDIRHR